MIKVEDELIVNLTAKIIVVERSYSQRWHITFYCDTNNIYNNKIPLYFYKSFKGIRFNIFFKLGKPQQDSVADQLPDYIYDTKIKSNLAFHKRLYIKIRGLFDDLLDERVVENFNNELVEYLKKLLQ